MDKSIYVTQAELPDFDEYMAEIRDIWETHWLTNMGPKHNQLQRALIDFLDVEKIDLLTNGHMALEMSLQAFDFPTASEVITTPFTFASTTHAIVRNGLIPVFCDINPVDYTIDVTKIENLITEKTVAILPVHVYGNVCDIEAIFDIANRYGLKVIYDAAHAFGVKYRGRGIGRSGDVSCFSFHATKVFNSIEGGAVCFNDSAFGKKIYQLKNFGIASEEIVDGIGANAKMNEFCAAMGLCNLRTIESAINKRKRIVFEYRNYLENVKGIQLSPIQNEVESNFSYFPIIIDEKNFRKNRDEVIEELKKEGIFPRKYFYPLTNEFKCYQGSFNSDNTPIAKWISERVMTLPLFPQLPIEDVKRICGIILR